MEHLERGYSNSSIPPDAYTEQCNLLLGQYNLALKAVAKKVGDLDKFMRQYQFDAPLAKNRFEEGVPATTILASASKPSIGLLRLATNTTEKFISMMDALALGYTEVDQLYPSLRELVTHLIQISQISNGITEFEGREEMLDWMKQLSKLSANQALTKDEIKQFQFDCEKAYTAFKNALPEA